MQQRSGIFWLGLGAAVALPVLFCVLAVPRFLEGLGARQARDLEIRTVLENPGTPAEYRAASRQLEHTLASDGDGLVKAAEMRALGAGGSAAELAAARALVIAGLREAPLNPRGWTLLCELDFGTPAAAPCMETGFFIAPFDWFTARRRALLAGHLLPQLTPEAQKAAARRVRLMWDADQWSDHRTRTAIYEISLTPNGPAMLQAGFQGDNDERRHLNRWLWQFRMYHAAK